MGSDSRSSRLLATVNSVHVSHHETGAGLSEEGPPSEESSSLIPPSCPYLRIFLVPTGSHVTTASAHPKQREKKSSSPHKFSMNVQICVAVHLLPDLWCDLFYLAGRPPLTGSDGAVTLSCSAEWCITGTRAHSHGMCFICYTNISAPLAYLIYSSDLLWRQTERLLLSR